MTREELRQKAHDLPRSPGVYQMRNRAGEIIYIGKAKALRNRVSQYFQENMDQGTKTRVMVSQVYDFDVIIVSSEFDALVLECTLIKRHMPKYNVLLKDDKGYPFIRLSQGEAYPRFTVAAKKEADGARYFGRYGGRVEAKAAIDAISKTLKLPVCSRKFPRDIGKERPCLHYHMGNCDGWCQKGMPQERYQEAIDQAVLLLEGKAEQVQKSILEEMEQAAEALRFERAAALRDRYQAIVRLQQRHQLVSGSMADTDAVGLHQEGEKAVLSILHYIGGTLLEKDEMFFSLPIEAESAEVIAAVLGQYYLEREQLPRRILLPCVLEEEENFVKLLSEHGGKPVKVLNPQRGEQAERVRVAGENASHTFSQRMTKEERESGLLKALGKLLGLSAAPRRIEAYDISNTGGSEIVAAMTVFQDGVPKKKAYRQFIIREQETPDDYKAMEEALRRRLGRYLEGDESFAPLPDLMLIDGGMGHVNVASRVLQDCGLSIPAFGMVKDDKHRTRGLISPEGREIGLKGNQSLFALIGSIQEETHRSAITFHQKRRSKSSYASTLDQIPGVGEARKKALYQHFKSIQSIKEASLEELHQVVPINTAQSVYDFFHPATESVIETDNE